MAQGMANAPIAAALEHQRAHAAAPHRQRLRQTRPACQQRRASTGARRTHLPACAGKPSLSTRKPGLGRGGTRRAPARLARGSHLPRSRRSTAMATSSTVATTMASPAPQRKNEGEERPWSPQVRQPENATRPDNEPAPSVSCAAWQHPRQHPDRPLRPIRPDPRTFWTIWTHRTDMTPGLPG